MKFPSKYFEPRYKKFFVYSLSIFLACAISYLWLDRPVAIFMARIHNPSDPLSNYDLTGGLTSFAYCCILIIMAFYAYKRIVSHTNSQLIKTAGGISFGVPVAFFVKTQFQYIFGRLVPRYDGTTTLLFVKHPTAYGFRFLGGGGSFPSGHMCVFTACLMIIVLHYPKFRPYAIAGLSILAFLLLFDNYHFLSDIIAGTYLGYIIAKITYRLET
jgi:membrane-associated phospholipid phosphatase